MSENVYWTLELTINPGRFEDLRSLMAEMIDATEKEPGALNYEWAISDDRQVCHLHERYQDSAAAMIHLRSFGTNFAARFLDVLKLTRCIVYGTTNAQVKDALAPFGPAYMAPLGGFKRDA
jgi:quinol monooxygenase YgiN